MKKLATILLAISLMLTPVMCFAADNASDVDRSSSTYSFTIIQDEETPLAGGEQANDSYLYLICVAVVAAAFVGCVSLKRVMREKSRANMENHIAEFYMGDLIK